MRICNTLLGSVWELEPITQFFAEYLHHEVGADVVSVFVWDQSAKENKRFCLLSEEGFDLSSYYIREDRTPKYFSRSMHADPINQPSAANALLFKELNEGYVKPYGVRSAYHVPLILAGEYVGLLWCDRTETDLGWNEQDRIHIGEAATELAMSIYRIRRTMEIKAAARKVETQNRVELHEKRNALAQTTDAIISTNSRNEVISCNDVACELFKYQKSDLIGSPLEILSPELSVNYGDKRDSKKPKQIVATTKNGEALYLLVTRSDKPQKGRPVATWTIKDISETIKLRELVDVLSKKHKSMSLQASMDGLTGTRSRENIFSAINEEVNIHDQTSSTLTVAMMDLDSLYKVNQQFGNAAGDLVLKSVVASADNLLRDSDYIGRYSGEEFIIVLPNTGQDDAANVLERIRQKIADQHVELEDHEGQIWKVNQTVSIGFAQFQKEWSVEDLIQMIDASLSTAKRLGANKIFGFGGDESFADASSV